MSQQVGFIGLGVMGAAMARNLLGAEGNVAVYDVQRGAVAALADEGATACASPAEVAKEAEIVGVSLPSPQALIDVISGPGGVLEPRSRAMRIFIDFSTTGPVVARQAAALVAAAGIEYIDSPVSGGPSSAVDGSLTLMLAGSSKTIEDATPYLSHIGSTRLLIGDQPGQGQLAKVINNLFGAATIAVVAEGLCLGVKGGIEIGHLLEVINASSGRSPVTQGLFPTHVLTRNFNLGFRLSLEAKDVGLCLEEGHRQKMPMPVSSAVEQFWSLANRWGSDGDDFTTAAKMVEEWAGVTLEAKETTA